MTGKDSKKLALVAIAGLAALTGITSLLVCVSDLKITEAASSVQAIGIVLAVWAGGLFALYKLNVFRDFKPKLNITLDIADRLYDACNLHISVVANLHNSSRVHVEPAKIRFSWHHVVPAIDAVPAPVEYNWRGRGLVIEPGESHIEVHSFCVNSDVKTVKIHVLVQSAEDDGLKWDTITFYDIATVSSGGSHNGE